MTAGMAARRRTGGQAGFGLVLRAEWTKFRTVRGWVIGMIVAVLVTVALGLLSSLASHSHCFAPSGRACPGPGSIVGPGGEPVASSIRACNASSGGTRRSRPGSPASPASSSRHHGHAARCASIWARSPGPIAPSR